MAAVGGDAASMVAVGLVWGATNALMRRGATNALMRRGALVWDRRSRSLPAGTGAVRRWADLLLTWQYSAPFLANPSASAAFFRLLGDAPISVAVPVTNATTFAATAVAAALLGEATRAAPAALGTALIVLGVWSKKDRREYLPTYPSVPTCKGPHLSSIFSVELVRIWSTCVVNV
ncbi:hypothetical protein ACQJBY_039108 [Aegilops geniculata]